MEIDMSGAQPLRPTLGKTEVPVSVVLGPTLDFSHTVPALKLRLTFRPEATSEQVALDVFRLYAAINQFDLSNKGGGLLPDEVSREEPTSNGTLSITFRLTEPVGAEERLEAVVQAINLFQEYPSLQRCEARVISVAA
jgi:hypothetical protein